MSYDTPAPGIAPAGPKDPAAAYNWFIVNSIQNMSDAYAREDWKQYYNYFDIALQAIMPAISSERRQRINNDIKALKLYIKIVKAGTEDNDALKLQKIQAAQVDFVDTHRFFLFSALPNVGIIKSADDGLLELTDETIRDVQIVIRGHESVIDGVNKRIEQNAIFNENEGKGQGENNDQQSDAGSH